MLLGETEGRKPRHLALAARGLWAGSRAESWGEASAWRRGWRGPAQGVGGGAAPRARADPLVLPFLTAPQRGTHPSALAARKPWHELRSLPARTASPPPSLPNPFKPHLLREAFLGLTPSLPTTQSGMYSSFCCCCCCFRKRTRSSPLSGKTLLGLDVYHQNPKFILAKCSQVRVFPARVRLMGFLPGLTNHSHPPPFRIHAHSTPHPHPQPRLRRTLLFTECDSLECTIHHHPLFIPHWRQV